MDNRIYRDRSARRRRGTLCAAALAAALMLGACQGYDAGPGKPSDQTRSGQETAGADAGQESEAAKETETLISPDTPVEFDLVQNPQDYITVSGDYKHITLDAGEFASIDMQSRIDSLLTAYETWEEVTDRSSLEGDKLLVDLVETLNGEELQNEKDKEIVLGLEQAAPGLDSYLEGLSRGQSVNVELTYPDDFYDEMLAGNTAVFQVTVKKVSFGVVPDYTDAFIAEHTDCANIKEWEASLEERMKKEQIDNAVSLWLAEHSELTPAADSLRKEYLDDAKAWYESYAASLNMTYEELLQMLGYESGEDFLASDEMTETIMDQIEEDMLYAYLMKEENLSGTYGEYQEYLESFAASAGYEDAAGLSGGFTEEELKKGFMERLILDYLEETVVLENADQ